MQTPFLGLRTTIYKVADLAKAKDWYSLVLQIQPYFDEPFYVGFNVAGYELGLQPTNNALPATAAEGVVTYWGVADIGSTYPTLLALGAAPHETPTEVGGGIVVATVKDPWGNLFGIIHNPHFKLPSPIPPVQTFTPREQIIETVNRLFVYTDYREWQKLQTGVFTPTVHFDMSSLGAGAPKDLPAGEICAMWESGFAGIDAVHHHSGSFLVTVNEDDAKVFCYATASHYKAAATQGHTREFVGSYDLGLQQTVSGWRINSFRYNVKYTGGNMELK